MNGCEQGKWKIYKEEGGLKSKVNFNFKHERKCKYSSFYNIEKETTILGDIYAYSLLEEKPEFPGGSPALQAFIAENTGYPVNSQLDRVCGQVIVSFVINTFGEVTSPKIYSGINEELDNEALRVISIMPRWTPGFRDATPVNVQIQVPFTFNIYK
ncbi:MAG: energy transducer TonB [Bacteroidia bacterium]|nr:energy transducer TonB [Bacteroidia bacterium]